MTWKTVARVIMKEMYSTGEARQGSWEAEGSNGGLGAKWRTGSRRQGSRRKEGMGRTEMQRGRGGRRLTRA